MENGPGRIITFYSYKGGTGRSMALANVAWILASQGKRVLMIDWDLEAPGLHRYFRPFLVDPELESTDGLVEMVEAYATRAIAPKGAGDVPADWYLEYADYTRYCVSVEFDFSQEGRIDLMPAGRQSEMYGLRVSSLNWQNLYDRLGGGGFFEAVKARVRGDYDYVLIDSRTGVSDTSGICSVQMPDVLVVCFTLNNQGIRGSAAIAHSALKQHQEMVRNLLAKSRSDKLTETPLPLRVFPVAMRVDSGETEKRDARQSLARRLFSDITSHLGSDVGRYWGAVTVPHSVFYSYEEVLATIKDEPNDPRSALSAFVSLAGYVTDSTVEYRPSLSPEKRQELLTAFAESGISSAPAPVPVPESDDESLIRRADAALTSLDGSGQKAALRVLSRLVKLGSVDEGGGALAIKVPLSEIPSGDQAVAHTLVRHGLLQITGQAEMDGPVLHLTATVIKLARTASEAGQMVALTQPRLPRIWPWLAKYLDVDRELLLWRQQLRAYIGDWHGSGRERGALLSGTLLAVAEFWRKTRQADLNQAELEYLRVSRQVLEKPEIAVDDRKPFQHDADIPSFRRVAKRRNARSRVWLAGAGMMALVLLSTVAYDRRARRIADDERNQARDNVRLQIAQATAFADPAQRLAALDLIAKTTMPDFAGLQIPPDVGPAVVKLPSAILRGPQKRLQDLRFDPAGEIVGAACSDGTIWLWRLSDGSPTVLDAQDGAALSLAIDTNRVAAGYASGRVRLWDSRGGGKVLFLGDTKSGPVRQVAFVKLDKENWLLTSSEDGSIGLWSLSDLPSRVFYSSAQKNRAEGRRLAPWDDVRVLADQNLIIAASSVHGFEQWTASEPRSFGKPVSSSLQNDFAKAHSIQSAIGLSPSGKTMAFVGLRKFGDPTTSSAYAAWLFIQQLKGPLREISVTPGGGALRSMDARPTLLALDDKQVVTIGNGAVPSITGVLDASYSLENYSSAVPLGAVQQLAIDPSGVAIATSNGAAVSVWPNGPNRSPSVFFAEGAAAERIRFAPGKPTAPLLAVAYADGTVRTWDVFAPSKWPKTLAEARGASAPLKECAKPRVRTAVLGESAETAAAAFAACEDGYGRHHASGN